MVWVAWIFPLDAVVKVVFLYSETGVSGILWSCLKKVKPVVMYDVEHGMALEPMQENRHSYRVDLEYTELFLIHAVTPVSF